MNARATDVPGALVEGDRVAAMHAYVQPEPMTRVLERIRG